jgi:hypothetical protein
MVRYHAPKGTKPGFWLWDLNATAPPRRDTGQRPDVGLGPIGAVLRAMWPLWRCNLPVDYLYPYCRNSPKNVRQPSNFPRTVFRYRTSMRPPNSQPFMHVSQGRFEFGDFFAGDFRVLGRGIYSIGGDFIPKRALGWRLGLGGAGRSPMANR